MVHEYYGRAQYYREEITPACLMEYSPNDDDDGLVQHLGSSFSVRPTFSTRDTGKRLDVAEVFAVCL